MLNTGRYRDQWHTMTRTGLSPKLSHHRREPLVEMHAFDAEKYGIADDDLVRVATPQGESVFRAMISTGQRRGEMFTPIHWTDRQSSGGRTGLLPRPLVDPHSGQPGFKSTPAKVEKLTFGWRGFLLARALPDRIDADYFTIVRVDQGWLVELAGNGDLDLLARVLLPRGERAENVDRGRGNLRIVVLDAGHVVAALYLTRNGRLPDREWLIGALGATESPTSIELLAGRPAVPVEGSGPIVCTCFDIGLKTIVEAIGRHGLMSVEAVGRALTAGTNCGSCRPAIQRLISESKEASLG
jgi:assimilatory nitrate reductase catalytic subunit